MIYCWVISLCCGIFAWQHNRTSRYNISGIAAILAVGNGNIRLVHKQVSLSVCQQEPIPIVDRIIQLILHIVNDNLLVFLHRRVWSRIVCILIRHHVEQFHSTM